jgi:hypothetical protein
LHEHSGAARQNDQLRPGELRRRVRGRVLDKMLPEIRAVAVDRSFAGDRQVVAVIGGDAILVAIARGWEIRGFGRELDRGAGFEMKIEIARQREGFGQEISRRDDDGSTPGVGAGGDGFFDGSGIERRAVTDGAEIGDIESRRAYGWLRGREIARQRCLGGRAETDERD